MPKQDNASNNGTKTALTKKQRQLDPRKTPCPAIGAAGVRQRTTRRFQFSRAAIFSFSPDAAAAREKRQADVNALRDLLARRIPRRPLAGDSPATGFVSMSKRAALAQPYIQINGPSWKGVIVVDCDHTETLLWHDRRAPQPNWIVISQRTGRHHLGYVIDAPVSWTDAPWSNAREAPQALFKRVRAMLTAACDGDPAYANAFARNPVASRLGETQTIILSTRPHSLSDLYVELRENVAPEHMVGATVRAAQPGDPVASRNCDLFDRLRREAYRLRAFATSPEAFATSIHGLAVRLNVYQPALPFSEVTAIARSVSKWTWRNISPDARRRGPLTAFPRAYAALCAQDKATLMKRRAWALKAQPLIERMAGLIRRGSSAPRMAAPATIARICRVSRTTVYKWLAAARRVAAGQSNAQIETIVDGEIVVAAHAPIDMPAASFDRAPFERAPRPGRKTRLALDYQLAPAGAGVSRPVSAAAARLTRF